MITWNVCISCIVCYEFQVKLVDKAIQIFYFPRFLLPVLLIIRRMLKAQTKSIVFLSSLNSMKVLLPVF